MRQLFLRLAVLCMVALGLSHCGSSDAVGVLVHVRGLSADVTSLSIIASVDGKPAMNSTVFTQQLDQFVIKLPSSGLGQGNLKIDATGTAGTGCIVSTGQATTQLSKQTVSSELDLLMTALPTPLCSPTQITLVTPSSGPTTGGTTLQIDGQNFVAGSTVKIAGLSASVMSITPTRIQAMLPPKAGAFGKVSVSVSNSYGQAVSRSDLFAYFSSTLQLSISTFALGGATAPYSVALADFNGDQKLDIVTANESGNNVSVLLGNGTGGFAVPTNFTVGTNPRSVVVGDFNRDLKADILVINYGSNSMSVLKGNGVGGFAPASTSGTGGMAPVSVAVTDFDADGKLDLAVATSAVSGNVFPFWGDGAGNFSLGSTLSAGSVPNAVAIGDVNADGRPDLVVANSSSDNVSVILATVTGSFGSTSSFATGQRPMSVAVSDVNGDQKPDLIVANGNSNSVSVLLGIGSGAFSGAMNFSVDQFPQMVVVGDLNGDLKLDVATANYNGNNVSVLLGNGMGGFGSLTNYPVVTGPQALAIADCNSDGKPDLVVANKTSNNVSVLLNVSQ